MDDSAAEKKEAGETTQTAPLTNKKSRCGVESKMVMARPFGHAASTCTYGELTKKLRRIAGIASGQRHNRREDD